ncbi:STN domain-containing protein [Pseudarcicella hirudinis]|uniref:STN domain-containing protein n=1 Tax=Pseudarcicella hirudinis TaxID=1079859 RepID=UPI0035EA18B1
MTNFLQILRKITYPGHFIAVFLYFASNSYAQSGLLDKPVTVKAYNERLTNILDLIAAQGNFNFSYNSNLIEDRRIDLTAVNKPVREILNVIFKGTVSYKVRGNYVILIKVRSNEERNISFFVSGYVVDDETGSALSDVSIFFDKVNLYSALTNKKMAITKIKVHSQDLPVKLIIEKDLL